MRTNRIVIAFIISLLCTTSYGKDWKELLKNEESSASGPVSLHICDDKLYLEFPDSLIGRSFIFGSRVKKFSNPLETYGGYEPQSGMELIFNIVDSLIVVSSPEHKSVMEDEFSGKAHDLSNIPAVVKTFKILSRKDNSYLCDVTSALKSKSNYNNALAPDAFNASEGYVKRNGSIQSSSTALMGIRADSCAVYSSWSFTYKVKSALLGVFSSGEQALFTTEIEYFLRTLPATHFVPVKADIRAGYNYIKRVSYTENGSKPEYLTSRRDTSGPLVFTIDEHFPDSWASAAEQAIRNWQEAFDKAGINLKMSYRRGTEGANMIHYVISPVQKITDKTFCDPRNGEILLSDIFVHHGVQEQIQKMLMLQTSAANPEARRINISEELLNKGLCALLMRHIGHAIGLRDNLIGSYAYDSKDLGDVVFTSEKGLSSSVMDRLPFNYISDSSETEFFQTKPGPADIFSLKCLYLYDYDDVVKALSETVTEQEIAFKALQSPKAFYDPRAEYGDLGNDVLYSVKKGLEHLKFTLENINRWVSEEDSDFTYRNYLRNYVLDQLHDYMRHGFEFVGGMYVNTPQDGMQTAAKRSFDKNYQKQCLIEMLKLIDSLDWVDNPDFIRPLELEGPYNGFIKKYFTNFAFIQLSGLSKSEIFGNDAYSQAEAARDIMDYLWNNPQKRGSDEFTRYQRELFINNIHNQMLGSDKPDIWYGVLKDARKLVKRSGDKYLLHILDKRLTEL